MKNSQKVNIRFYRQLLINFSLILLLVLTPILIFLCVNNRKLYKQIQEYEYKMSFEMIEKTRIFYDNTIRNIDHSMLSIGNTDVIRRFSEELSFSDEIISEASIILSGFRLSTEYINDVQLFSLKNQYLLSEDSCYSANDKEFFTKTFEWYSLASNNINDNSLTIIAGNGNIWIVTNVMKDGEKIAYFAVEIDLAGMADSLAENDITLKDKSLFVLTGYGEIMYCNNSEKLYRNPAEALVYSQMLLETGDETVTSVTINGERALLAKNESSHGNWIYAFLDYSDTSILVQKKVFNIVVLPFIWALAFSVLSVFLITIISYIPLQRIMRVFVSSDIPEEENELLHSGKFLNETTFIVNSMMRLIKNSRNMEAEVERQLHLLNKAQSIALQMQTNPHFLYNSLDTIRWVALEECGNESKTSQMLIQLSKFYRKVFLTDDIMISLAAELEILRLYTDIIDYRFSHGIKFVIVCPECLLNVKCIKMTLQPIVENSVIHGLRQKHYSGTIKIDVTEENGKIKILVQDDGVGMTRTQIEQKNAELCERKSNGESLEGLCNVNERIRLIYGDDYGVQITSLSDGTDGLSVHITFPKI